MSALYVLSILVTGEQEDAIKDQFDLRGWGFYKTGVRQALKDELDLFYKDVAAKITQFTKTPPLPSHPDVKDEVEPLPAMRPVVLITAPKTETQTLSDTNQTLQGNCAGLTPDSMKNPAPATFITQEQPVKVLLQEPTFPGAISAGLLTVKQKTHDSDGTEDYDMNSNDESFFADESSARVKVEPLVFIQTPVKPEPKFIPGNSVSALISNARSGAQPPEQPFVEPFDMSTYHKRQTGMWSQQTRYGVNRNIRHHNFHKRCKSIPDDLDASNYSAKESGYYCKDCGYIFPKKNKFLIHKNSRANRNCLRYCIFCDAEENKGEFHYCTKCPQVYETKDLLDRHEQRHITDPYRCKICSKPFYTMPEVRHHIKIEHAGEEIETHLCEECGQNFKTKYLLKTHKNNVHDTDDRPWRCDTCCQRFKKKSTLERHNETHGKQENISCEFCGKIFSKRRLLYCHVQRHRKDYKYFCNICNKGFYQREIRDDHLNYHRGDKPHACNLCDYKCANYTNLLKHRKIHARRGEIAPRPKRVRPLPEKSECQ